MPSLRPKNGIIAGQTGAQRLIGYKIDVGQPDRRARAVLEVGPDHANRIGALHGGIIAMLLDAAMGFTASLYFGEGEPEVPLVTVSMTTNFVSIAKIGSTVTATGLVAGREDLIEEAARQGFDMFADLMNYAYDKGQPSAMAACEATGRAYLAFARSHQGHYIAMFESGLSVNRSPLPAAQHTGFARGPRLAGRGIGVAGGS